MLPPFSSFLCLQLGDCILSPLERKFVVVLFVCSACAGEIEIFYCQSKWDWKLELFSSAIGASLIFYIISFFFWSIKHKNTHLRKVEKKKDNTPSRLSYLPFGINWNCNPTRLSIELIWAVNFSIIKFNIVCIQAEVCFFLQNLFSPFVCVTQLLNLKLDDRPNSVYGQSTKLLI